MTDLVQVVAAVATGALLTVATMLVFKVYGMQRRSRERRIGDATDAVLAGVETFRQQAHEAPPGAPDDVVEVRSKAHLRMLAGRDTGAALGPAASCERKQQDRATRGRRARESRP